MLRAVIKTESALRGYSIIGSFLTFVSIVGFEIAYYLLGNVVGFALGWATVAFWFIAFVYSFRQRLKDNKKQKETIELNWLETGLRILCPYPRCFQSLSCRHVLL